MNTLDSCQSSNCIIFIKFLVETNIHEELIEGQAGYLFLVSYEHNS